MGELNTESLREAAEGLLLAYGMRVVGALAVLIIGWMIAKAVKRGMQRLIARTEFDETLEVFVASLVYWIVLVVVLFAVLGVFGVPTTSAIAVLGTAGLAIGLAMQGTLSNFAAGFMLLIFRPFRVGDYIEAAGTAGSVFEIGIFATTLNTSNNIRVIVPNSAIDGAVISNYSHNDRRRHEMVIGISYDDDIGKAIEIVERILESDERVLDEPAPLVAVKELGGSSVDLVIRPWCRRQDYGALGFDLNRRFKEELEAGGCSLPYPQQDVHLIQEPAA